MQGLGGQAQQAGMADTESLFQLGGQQQQLTQSQLEAQRQNAMMRQQAPLAQYQSLLPFISAVPTGTTQTQTAYTPRPSALQAGLATGLGAFGAMGNFMNQGQGQGAQQGRQSPAAPQSSGFNFTMPNLTPQFNNSGAFSSTAAPQYDFTMPNLDPQFNNSGGLWNAQSPGWDVSPAAPQSSGFNFTMPTPQFNNSGGFRG